MNYVEQTTYTVQNKQFARLAMTFCAVKTSEYSLYSQLDRIKVVELVSYESLKDNFKWYSIARSFCIKHHVNF
jgi:hypothetical protein